jgi:hypothetical protein
MPRLTVRWLLVACCGLALSMHATFSPAQTAVDQAGAALAQLEQWLDGWPAAPGWREYLLLDQLRGQLAARDQADPITVWKILGRFGAGYPGVDRTEFHQVRRAVARWLAELPPPPPERLMAELQAARKAFQAPDANTVAEAKAALTAALETLNARLGASGQNGADWRRFLQLGTLEQQLGKNPPNLAALDGVYAQFASGREGLELAPLAKVREALKEYLLAVRALSNPALMASYQEVMDRLAARIEQYRQAPSAEAAAAINRSLQFIIDAGQPERVAVAIQRNFSYPNVYLRVSADLIAAGIDRPVSYAAPVNDVILGTTVYANSMTTGKIKARLVPSPNQAVVDMLFQGSVVSNSIGYAGNVQLQSLSCASVSGRKSLLMDPLGAATLPAVSAANTNNDVRGIQANSGIAERAAWRRVSEQKAEAEQEASRHTEQRVNQRLDEEANRGIGDLNRRYQERIRGPLTEHNLFPRLAAFSSTADATHVAATEGRVTELAAPWGAPEADGVGDFSAQVHQSAVVNAGNDGYAGATVAQEPFMRTLEDYLGKVPEQLQDRDKSPPWAITLAARDPISARFDNDLVTFTLRGQAYTSGDMHQPAMNVTAVYAIQRTGQGVKFVRQGPLAIFPPGYEPGKGQSLSVPEQRLRTQLERRFGRVFEPEITPKPLTLSGNWKKAGQLGLVAARAHAGWLALTWKRIPGTEGAGEPSAAPSAPAPVSNRAPPVPAPLAPGTGT